MLPLLRRAESYGDFVAVSEARGEHTYAQLLEASHCVASALLNGQRDLNEARVAFLMPPGGAYVASLWGIWRAGGIAVPLCDRHPQAELEHVVGDSGADCILTADDFATIGHALAQSHRRRLLISDALSTRARDLPLIPPERRALIMYTSGTSGKPKGVVTTHAQVQAQIQSLVHAWEWQSADRILHALPLHHVHGIVNALLCALWSGAICEFIPFEARGIWARFARGGITLFMGVPTMYAKLIAAWEGTGDAERRAWSSACSQLRLMISGSAALPVRALERWREISGHTLLERYGMTELGMALSNPLRGERRPGCVGHPLPGVTTRIVDEQGNEVADGRPGELEVRGDSVFLEYWNRPAETRAAFRDGWFRTGDVAALEDGSYRLLGRGNVDIVKTGGYKVSALEVEEVLREHPLVDDCAVVGVPDAEWGERIAVALSLREGARLSLEELRAWSRERLAPYKIPSRLRIDKLPRNSMGKVLKPQIAQWFEEGQA